ncbi:hypothetical protein DB346_19720 [Verrucomicrobia bacterium LW23]|nr:hypothetical protein DB346_19720 [Verrucomicrobia bacterium LW23]
MQTLTRHVRFLLPALTLGAWGTVFIHAVAAKRLNNLLVPWFHTSAEICGIVLVLLAVWHVLFFTPLPPQADRSSAAATADRGGWMAAARGLALTFLLLVPMLASAHYAPDTFSFVAAQQRQMLESPGSLGSSRFSAGRDTRSMPVPDPSGRPVYLEVNHVLDIGDNPELTAQWEGKRVRTVAQYYPGEEEGTFRVVRFFMWCCASDSTALPVSIRGASPLVQELQPMDWVELTGTVKVVPAAEGNRAEVQLETLNRCPRPATPFLY